MIETRFLLFCSLFTVASACTGASPPAGPKETPRCLSIAGDYTWANGFEYEELTLGADCGIAVKHGDDSVNSWSTSSSARLLDDRLSLETNPDLVKHEWPLEFRLVTWASRKYLIPADRLVAFCNAVNAGVEPSRRQFFLVTPPRPHESLAGLPAVPADVAHYLLPRPLRGRVLKVERPEAYSTVRVGKCKDRRLIQTALVQVSVGRRDGALPGMVLYGANPKRPSFYAEMKIKTVSDVSAVAEASFLVTRFRVDDPVSTEMPPR